MKIPCNVHNIDAQKRKNYASHRTHTITNHTTHTKAILEQASQALGVSVSYFILDSAYQRAAQTVRDINQIRLNDDEWQRAIAMLDAPAKPPSRYASIIQQGFYLC